MSAHAGFAVEWTREVLPRLVVPGFLVSGITVDRCTIQVANTSQGRLPAPTVAHRTGILRAHLAKHSALLMGQYYGMREITLAMDRVQPYPALSVIMACGITGVPFSSLQYNWCIQDTYKYHAFTPPGTNGLSSYIRQKIAPGVAWAFLRAGIGTGGGLFLGPKVSTRIDGIANRVGLQLPPLTLKIAGGLASGGAMALATQGVHNVTLVAGRMMALGEKKQAPHYTTVAMRAAWREFGISVFYLNFQQRFIIQAVNVCVLSLCNIFHRPELACC